MQRQRGEAPAGGVSVRVLREIEALAPLRATWTALSAHPWSDFDHVVDHQALHPDFLRPHVLVLERAGAVVGLVIASLRRESLPFRIGSLTVARSRGRLLRFSGGGLLGEDSPETARAIAGELQAALRRGEADAVYLHQLDGASPLAQRVQAVSGWSRDRWARPVGGWMLELPETYEAFLDSRSKSTRRHIKRYANALEREIGPDLSITCHREPADLERLVADSERVARLTYHRGMGVGFEDTPSTRESFARWLASGWMRGYVMRLGERPIAFWHALAYRGTLFTRDTGFDPEFGELRPGQYLLSHMIAEHCRVREVERLDYGLMELDYKRQFGSTRYERTSLYLFSRRPKGLYLSALRSTSGLADRAARKLLGPRARQWARKLARTGRAREPEKAPLGPT